MNESTVTLKVWDAPTRLFHWLLVALVAVSVSTGYVGGNLLRWHVWSGCAILGLLIFRFLWGFAGSTYARFGHFLRGPRTLLGYARGLAARAPSHALGHNPLGGWMVVLILAVLAFQTGTGLFANDDIAAEGPLYPKVSKALSDTLSGWHQTSAVVLLVLVATHVAAVLYHLFYKRENLIAPMITGAKRVPGGPIPPARFPGVSRALAAALATAAALYLILNA